MSKRRFPLESVALIFILFCFSGFTKASELHNKFKQLYVKMTDGTELDTYYLLPQNNSQTKHPTILIRTPYWYLLKNTQTLYQGFTRKGYAVVIQVVRGVGNSKGTIDPLAQEYSDGRDTANWIFSQTWSDGNIGAIGGSYEGHTALAAAVSSPHIKVVIADGAPIHGFKSWPVGQNGVVEYELFSWLYNLKTTDYLRDFTDNPELDYMALSLGTNLRPLINIDKHLTGEEYPVWREMAKKFSINTSSDLHYWLERELAGKLKNVCAAVLNLQARREWSDDPLEAYLELIEAPKNVKSPNLHARSHKWILGYHSHTQALNESLLDTKIGRIIRDYLATYLKNDTRARKALFSLPPILYNLASADTDPNRPEGQWKSATKVVENPDSQKLYLYGPSAGLSNNTGDLIENVILDSKPLTYTFDPDNDDTCFKAEGIQRLTYHTSSVLGATRIVGRPSLTLNVAISGADTDLFVDLFEVGNNGDRHLISEGKLALKYRSGYEKPLLMKAGRPAKATIHLGTVAYDIKEDSHLEVVISSTKCGYAENPNTGLSALITYKALPITISVLEGVLELPLNEFQ